MKFYTIVAIMAISLAGCGSSAGDSAAGETAATTPAPAAFNKSAAEVAQALIAAGLPVVDQAHKTAENDENQLLGRPHQYTSKTDFKDSRHRAGGEDTLNQIEVFANADDAKVRADYVERVTQGMPMLTQYIYQAGPVVLRLNKSLTPTEAAAYEAALKTIVGGS